MKARLSSTIWLLVFWIAAALFGVLGSAYHAGKNRAGYRCSMRLRCRKLRTGPCSPRDRAGRASALLAHFRAQQARAQAGG